MKMFTSVVGVASAFSLGVACMVGAASGVQAVGTDDPTDPTSLFEQIADPDVRKQLQTTARLDGQDTVFRIKGTVKSNVPGNAYSPKLPHGQTLFGFEGYNVRQWYRAPGTDDIYMLSREIVFYTDVKTGAVVNEWTNPLDGKTRPIVQVANEHVNQGHLRVKDGKLFSVFGDQLFPYTYRAGLKQFGREIWQAPIPPLYSLKERYGIDDDFGLVNGTYAAWEIFNTSVETEAVKPWTKEILHSSMPTMIDWTRTGPTVPWMCIAEATTDVHLLYNAQSWTLDSFDDLEPWIKDLVKAQYPLYEAAPNAVDPTPNDTTWTAFYESELKGKGQGGADLKWSNWCSGVAPAASTATALKATPATQVFGADEKHRTVLKASVTSTGDQPPTGTVTFAANGETLGTAPVTNGSATYRLPAKQAAGRYPVVATYEGDDRSAASTSTAVAVEVKKAASRTALKLQKNVYRQGAPKTPQAIANLSVNTGVQADGKVAFRIDGKNVVRVEVKNGQARFGLPSRIGVGLHSVTAAYSGSSNISGSRSGLELFLVVP